MSEKIVYGRKQFPRRKVNKPAPKRALAKAKPKKRYLKVPNGAIIGYGDYQMNPEDKFGKRYGGYLGSMAGEALGGLAHNLFGGLTGLGDYKVKHNVLMGDPPVIANIPKRGGVVVQHREYLGDLISSANAGAFSLQNFLINPANETTFPWLAQVASQYEEYSFEGLVFEYKSMSANALNSTNTALGTVIMATDYNAGNANFASKSEMENYEFGQSCAPSCSMLHPIECAPRQTAISTELYTLNGAVPSGQDTRLYNWGNFQIATVGMQGTSVNCGEIWITYQVVLQKPKMFASLGNQNGVAHYTSIATGAGNATPLGNSAIQTAVGPDTIGLSFTSTVITLPTSQYPQSYLLEVIWVGTAANCVAPVITLAGCIADVFKNVGQTPASGTSSTQMIEQIAFTTKGLGNAVTLTFGGAGTLPTAISQIAIRMVQIPNIAA